MGDVFFRQDIPFSEIIFKMIIEKFDLPSSTPWAFGTNGSHFQRYNLNDRKATSPRTGNFPIVQLDVNFNNVS